MNALGIHLTRRGARTVLVGADGVVMSSTTVEHTEPEDAVQRALHQLSANPKPDAVGIATDPVDSIDR